MHPYQVVINGGMAMCVLDAPTETVMFVCRFCGGHSAPVTSNLPAHFQGVLHDPRCFAIHARLREIAQEMPS